MSYTNTIKSIAIGSFDGLHLGHQALVKQVEAIVVIERNGGYLTPGYKRSCHTDRPCFFYHFDKIKGFTPDAFMAKLMEDFPALEEIIVGYDFHFGKDKSGNVEVLERLFNGRVKIIPQVCYEDVPVHSRTIKQYLREGRIELANKLLGRAYEIEGEVIRGQGLGKRSFVPTLNLFVDHYQLPMEGVYATQTQLNGQWYDSVSFLGNRVTTDGNFAVETHILDKQIDTVQSSVSLCFIELIRVNKKFENFDELKIQIAQDIDKVRDILS